MPYVGMGLGLNMGQQVSGAAPPPGPGGEAADFSDEDNSQYIALLLEDD